MIFLELLCSWEGRLILQDTRTSTKSLLFRLEMHRTFPALARVVSRRPTRLSVLCPGRVNRDHDGPRARWGSIDIPMRAEGVQSHEEHNRKRSTIA